MKIEKNVVYKESDNSYVNHNGKHYAINKLLDISKNTIITHIPVDYLKWILSHTTTSKFRIDKADLSFPILVLFESDKYYVLDGAHRLSKAICEGRYSLPAKIIIPEQI